MTDNLAPSSIVEEIQAIDLAAFGRALEAKLSDALYFPIRVRSVERDAGSTRLRIEFSFPHEGDEEKPEDVWVQEAVSVDAWRHPDWMDEGELTLAWDGAELDGGCSFLETAIEDISDTQANTPSPGEGAAPAAAEATSSDGEGLDEVDLGELAVYLNGEAQDAMDGTARVVSVERVAGTDSLRVQAQTDPTQDGDWSKAGFTLAWTGRERFAHDVLEALGRLVDDSDDS